MPTSVKGGPAITGLTGELAMQKMSKAMRKKVLEEQKLEEQRAQELKERIKKKNIEREAEKI